MGERDDELQGREQEQAEDIAVHRTEPDQAADEGYPIGEIEEGTEWRPKGDARKTKARSRGDGSDDHEA